MKEFSKEEIYNFISNNFKKHASFSDEDKKISYRNNLYLGGQYYSNINMLEIYFNENMFYEFNILFEHSSKSGPNHFYKIKEIQDIETYTIDDVINKTFNKTLNKINI